MNSKSILIINDVTGYGRVSSFAMLPVMSAYGYHPYVLPTALVSNTMDYGNSAILDTTGFMRDAIEKWRGFGFGFSVISTGLINSSEQIDIICDLIDSQGSPFVLVDPIMADDGQLYPGMYEKAVECYRKLAARSNIIVPNFTEATMIAEMFEDRTSLNDDEFCTLINGLKKYAAHDIVITGCRSNDGMHFNLAYSAKDEKIEKIEYETVPISLVGTGDVFSACLLCEYMNGTALSNAVKGAAELVRKIAQDNIDNPDRFDIVIENTLLNVIKGSN